jgi:hypothetical protein
MNASLMMIWISWKRILKNKSKNKLFEHSKLIIETNQIILIFPNLILTETS